MKQKMHLVGVNASRGDVGAYNLRNMGVGNTLTLLNGRRLVNNGTYQTELLVETLFPQSQLTPTLFQPMEWKD